jgi:hypothetical protein
MFLAFENNADVFLRVVILYIYRSKYIGAIVGDLHIIFLINYENTYFY